MITLENKQKLDHVDGRDSHVAPADAFDSIPKHFNRIRTRDPKLS